MKTILSAALLLFIVNTSFAQEKKILEYNNDTNLIEATYYHANGEVSQKGNYTVDGKLHGEWLSYCQQGNKLVSAKYDNGRKVGKWFYWSGKNLKEVDYSNNAIASVNEWTNNNAIAENN